VCELIATYVESHPNPKRAHLYNVKNITIKLKKKQRLMNRRFFHDFYFVSVRWMGVACGCGGCKVDAFVFRLVNPIDYLLNNQLWK
jgi:hypothetical protein